MNRIKIPVNLLGQIARYNGFPSASRFASELSNSNVTEVEMVYSGRRDPVVFRNGEPTPQPLAHVPRRISTRYILETISCPHLKLYRITDGYFLFEYSNQEKNLYETRTVQVYRLMQLTYAQWLEEGRTLVRKMKEVEERGWNKPISTTSKTSSLPQPLSTT